MNNHKKDSEKLHKKASQVIQISIVTGSTFLLIGTILFLFGRDLLAFDKSIDATTAGQYGDFVGGILGALLSFAGVLLFYYALRMQSLELSRQIKEFEEMNTHYEQQERAFQEQLDNIRVQNFETSFYKQIELSNEVLNNIEYESEKGLNVFTHFLRVAKKGLSRRSLSWEGAINEIYDSSPLKLMQYFDKLESLIITLHKNKSLLGQNLETVRLTLATSIPYAVKIIFITHLWINRESKEFLFNKEMELRIMHLPKINIDKVFSTGFSKTINEFYLKVYHQNKTPTE